MENSNCWKCTKRVIRNEVINISSTGFENLCHFFNKNFNRIPPPQLPPFSIVSDILGDAISIAIVSFAINISMAKMFAKKYKYEISPNQV